MARAPSKIFDVPAPKRQPRNEVWDCVDNGEGNTNFGDVTVNPLRGILGRTEGSAAIEALRLLGYKLKKAVENGPT